MGSWQSRVLDRPCNVVLLYTNEKAKCDHDSITRFLPKVQAMADIVPGELLCQNCKATNNHRKDQSVIMLLPAMTEHNIFLSSVLSFVP